MERPGPKEPPGLTGGLSKQTYKCQACQVEPRGTDLPKHYEKLTDWSLLNEMKQCIGDSALDGLRRRADPHTLFIYEKHYTKQKLPTYRTHVMVKQKGGKEQQQQQATGIGQQGGSKDDQPPKKKQKAIDSFFLSVGNVDSFWLM